MTFTVLGASGFIGSALVRRLREAGEDCFAPARDDPALFNRHLGHVIFCIGLTADYREHPLETVDAHVCRLAGIMGRASFESLLYLSSTRVYRRAGATLEDSPLVVASMDPDDVYDISKLMGESLCRAAGAETVRVARLANVCGVNPESAMFFDTVLRDAVLDGRVTLRTAPDSAKDYVFVDDVVDVLIHIATTGRHRIYNVASGRNVSHAELLGGLERLTGCDVTFAPDAPATVYPPIVVDRLREEFGAAPASVLDRLDEIVTTYQHSLVPQ